VGRRGISPVQFAVFQDSGGKFVFPLAVLHLVVPQEVDSIDWMMGIEEIFA
jgi:hypothetical protein